MAIKTLLTALAQCVSSKSLFQIKHYQSSVQSYTCQSDWCRPQFILIENEIAKSINFDDLINEFVDK